jgi:hypothetical protein
MASSGEEDHLIPTLALGVMPQGTPPAGRAVSPVCASAASAWGRCHSMARYISTAVDSAASLPLAGGGVEGAKTQVAMRLSGRMPTLSQARPAGSRLQPANIGAGMGLTTPSWCRARLVPACLLLSARSSAWRMLPGLLAAPCQPTDLAEPGDAVGDPSPPVRTCSLLPPAARALREAPGVQRRSPGSPPSVATGSGRQKHDREPDPAPTPGWRPGPPAR